MNSSQSELEMAPWSLEFAWIQGAEVIKLNGATDIIM